MYECVLFKYYMTHSAERKMSTSIIIIIITVDASECADAYKCTAIKLKLNYLWWWQNATLLLLLLSCCVFVFWCTPKQFCFLLITIRLYTPCMTYTYNTDWSRFSFRLFFLLLFNFTFADEILTMMMRTTTTTLLLSAATTTTPAKNQINNNMFGSGGLLKSLKATSRMRIQRTWA